MSLLLLSLWGCGNNSVQEATRQVAKVVPALETVSTELTREKMQCDTPIKTATPRGCSIQTITCGSVVEGNNPGMARHFGDSFYVAAFCTPQRHYYEESGEAVYRLEIPANIQADVKLESDCADLDVVSFTWDETDRCPTEDHSSRLLPCEMDTDSGGGSIRMTSVDKPEIYVVAVDGKQGASGNYRLTVTCATYR